MGVKIEIPQGNEALTEFVQFHDRVYDYRDARWPAPLELQLPILTGDSPFAQGREIRPFLAYEGSSIVARAVAVMDERYNRHWQEHLGHLVMFEAMPDAAQRRSNSWMQRVSGWRSEAPKLREQASACWISRLLSTTTNRCRRILRARIPIITTGFSRMPVSNQRRVGSTTRSRFGRNWFRSGATRWRARVAGDMRLCRSKTFLMLAALLTSPILGRTPSSPIGALHR